MQPKIIIQQMTTTNPRYTVKELKQILYSPNYTLEIGDIEQSILHYLDPETERSIETIFSLIIRCLLHLVDKRIQTPYTFSVQLKTQVLKSIRRLDDHMLASTDIFDDKFFDFVIDCYRTEHSLELQVQAVHLLGFLACNTSLIFIYESYVLGKIIPLMMEQILFLSDEKKKNSDNSEVVELHTETSHDFSVVLSQHKEVSRQYFIPYFMNNIILNSPDENLTVLCVELLFDCVEYLNTVDTLLLIGRMKQILDHSKNNNLLIAIMDVIRKIAESDALDFHFPESTLVQLIESTIQFSSTEVDHELRKSALMALTHLTSHLLPPHDLKLYRDKIYNLSDSYFDLQLKEHLAVGEPFLLSSVMNMMVVKYLREDKESLEIIKKRSFSQLERFRQYEQKTPELDISNVAAAINMVVTLITLSADNRGNIISYVLSFIERYLQHLESDKDDYGTHMSLHLFLQVIRGILSEQEFEQLLSQDKRAEVLSQYIFACLDANVEIRASTYDIINCLCVKGQYKLLTVQHEEQDILIYLLHTLVKEFTIHTSDNFEEEAKEAKIKALLAISAIIQYPLANPNLENREHILKEYCQNILLPILITIVLTATIEDSIPSEVHFLSADALCMLCMLDDTLLKDDFYPVATLLSFLLSHRGTMTATMEFRFLYTLFRLADKYALNTNNNADLHMATTTIAVLEIKMDQVEERCNADQIQVFLPLYRRVKNKMEVALRKMTTALFDDSDDDDYLF
jgi:hypothetical protein